MPESTSGDSDLCLGHLNIRSLPNKTDKIAKMLANIDVLALTETHLDDEVKNPKLNIKNFRLYRKDRNRRGGGVGLYIRETFRVIPRSDLDHKELEMIWVEIYLQDTRPVLVGCCYRTSNSQIDYFYKICRTIEIVPNEDKHIFLLGDFNINWLVTKNNAEQKKKEKIDFISSLCGLNQIMDEPTRVDKKRSTKTCIDHIYTNISELSSNPQSLQVQSVSDHNLITCTVEIQVLRRSNTGTDPTVHSEPPEFPVIENKININQHSFDFESTNKVEVHRLLYLSHATELNRLSTYVNILNSCINKGEFQQETHESLISSWILEKVLLLQMEKYFNTLTIPQDPLDKITDQWMKDVENLKEVGVVFMDFSFPSDVIPDLLLHKLRSYGFRDLAISLIKSCFSHRNSCSCRWTDTHCGLPRGSCMTHFLLSVYTNDLIYTLQKKGSHFVVSGSQLMMYHTADDYKGLKILRKKSEVVRNWLRKNGMVLKTFTSTMIRSKTQMKQIRTRLSSIRSLTVKEFNWIRVLGVLLHDAPHLVWTS